MAHQITFTANQIINGEIHLWKIDISSSEQSYQPLHFYRERKPVSPAPDGCYPNFTTAEGCNALNALSTGAGNTGLGWRSLFSVGDGNFNTGVGAGALLLNTT